VSPVSTIQNNTASNHASRVPYYFNQYGQFGAVGHTAELGKANFNPRPNDIINFDVIIPLLQALHQWQHPVRLMKVKSRSGCLMNERVDDLAERGYSDGVQEVCPAPQKYGSLWLKVQPHVRVLAAQCQNRSRGTVPRIGASGHCPRKRIRGANMRSAVSKCSTTFVWQLLINVRGHKQAKWAKVSLVPYRTTIFPD